MESLGILSLCFGFAGSVVLSYGLIAKGLGAAQKSFTSYFGSNPHAVKDLYYGKAEAIAGVVLLFLSFLLLLIEKDFSGLGVMFPKSIIARIVVACAFVGLLCVITIRAADFVAYRQVKGTLLAHQRKRFEKERLMYMNDGVSEEERQRTDLSPPSESTKSLRLQSAKKAFDDLEDLFELPKHGTWDERVKRLETLFATTIGSTS